MEISNKIQFSFRSLFTETIQSQWDLVCEKTQLANFAQTVTMLGILCGNMVFGILSDKYVQPLTHNSFKFKIYAGFKDMVIRYSTY